MGQSNALRRILVGAGAGVIVLGIAGGASAQSLTGGCTGTVNGRAPESMTKDDPLQVAKDEAVTVSGNVPPSVASAPPNTIKSSTAIYVDVFGFPIKIKTVRTKRGASWGGSAELPTYLTTLATGIYRVSGYATGSPGGWSCSGSGYIQLDGKALTKPATYIGAGLAGAGAAAALSGKKPKKGKKNAAGMEIVQMIKELAKDLTADFGATGAWVVAILLVLYLMGAISPLALLLPLASLPGGGGGSRTWVRGRPIKGFFGGLLLGLGLSVVLQQFGMAALDRDSLYAILAVGVLTAIRSWLGTPLITKPNAPPPDPVATEA